jgi:hypothetical protein
MLSLGWLEPLLDRIARNSSNVVCPVIRTIDDNSFAYKERQWFSVGGFDWDLRVSKMEVMSKFALLFYL